MASENPNRQSQVLSIFVRLGLVKRKECWVVTGAVKAVICSFLVVSIFVGCRKANRFLCVNEPVQGEILIVEGWIPERSLKSAMAEFNSGKYRLLVTAGVPVPDESCLKGYATFADVGAAAMIKLGARPDTVVPVPAPSTQKDRTFIAARAVGDWLRANKSDVRAVNVLTWGPHARRTRLLYQRALGTKITVGVLSTQDEDYDQERWWSSSAGVRTVVGETIAYLYACCFSSEE